jgi:hypothetical protein
LANELIQRGYPAEALNGDLAQDARQDKLPTSGLFIMLFIKKVNFILITISLLLAGCSGDVLQASYADYAAAEAAGNIARGWIPPFVPASAIQIEGAHDLDTNQSCLVAHLPDPDEQLIVASLTADGFDQVKETLVEIHMAE